MANRQLMPEDHILAYVEGLKYAINRIPNSDPQKQKLLAAINKISNYFNRVY